jgi:hypothetical protein
VTKTVCVKTTGPVQEGPRLLFHAVYFKVPDAVAVAPDNTAESKTDWPGLMAVALRVVASAGIALTLIIRPLVTGLVWPPESTRNIEGVKFPGVTYVCVKMACAVEKVELPSAKFQ